MLTLKKIIEMIRTQEKPCWKLGYRSGYQVYPVHSFSNSEAPIEESIASLNHQVSFFKESPTTVFSISFSKSPKSNGEAVSGPFEFVNSEDSGPGVSVNGLGGMPVNASGWMSDLGGAIPRNYMEDRLALERDRTMIAIDRNNLENERKLFQEEKRKAEAEISKLKEKYESHSERAKNGVVMALEHVAGNLFGNSEKGKGLLGGPTVEVEKPAEEETEQYKLVSSFAQHLHEELTEVEDLKIFDSAARRLITKVQNRELS